MKPNPFVSIIIPTHHDWSRLSTCLEALSKQVYPQERYEVIVINNDPKDPPPHGFRLLGATIHHEAKPGSYAARNLGIRIARGDVLAFTDSDCIPDKYWIAAAVESLLEGAERVAGHIELFFSSERLTMAESYEKAFSFDQVRYTKQGATATANLVTWKMVFSRVGDFNEELLSGGDIEWGRRASKLGVGIRYSYTSIVLHPARQSISALLQKRRRVLAGLQKLEKGPPGWALFKAIITAAISPFTYGVRAARNRRLSKRELLLAILAAWSLKVYGVGQLLLRNV